MMIQPKYLTLKELLNGRLFEVPAYQRAYSWERKQRLELFSDIENLTSAEDGTVHFMATVVGLSRGKQTIVTDEFQKLEVVDGQQRLTTLIILLKCLSEALIDAEDENERALADETNSLLVKRDELRALLLQFDHDEKHYFLTFLREGSHPPSTEATTLANRRLLEAMEDCAKFVSEWAGSKLDLGIILKNRLAFIFHEIDDEATVYTVFEVLNSRGLDVAWLDRLKSILMGIAFDKGGTDKESNIKELHEIWEDIYRCLGLHKGMSSESLRFAAALKSTAQSNRVPSEEDAVETLRKLASGSIKNTIDISRWIRKVVNAREKLEDDKRRTAVTKIAHARLLAVAIELADIPSTQRDELLRAWEKVTFRIFGMCRKDARTRVGDYVRLARRIMSGDLDHKDALKEIRTLATGEFSIQSAVDQLRGRNCYGEWEEELRYFMFRYEEHLAREAGHKYENNEWIKIWRAAPGQSIEHISPQSSNYRYMHRLGNLVLLPPQANSSLQDKPPKEKGPRYESTGLFIARELKPLLEKGWTENSVKSREERLLKWAKREWAD